MLVFCLFFGCGCFGSDFDDGFGRVVASSFHDSLGGFDAVKTPDHVFLFYSPNDFFRLAFPDH